MPSAACKKIEEACARELKEEAGLTAIRVRYHSTQPWPYPNSLMIGLIAEVENDQATPDQTEISEVRWFTRAEARDLIAGKIYGVNAPGRLAIAAQLIRAWADFYLKRRRPPKSTLFPYTTLFR